MPMQQSIFLHSVFKVLCGKSYAMHFSQLLVFGFLILSLYQPQPVESQTRNVSVIAHMVNTRNAVRWALNQGANAVEMDLCFDPYSSTPVKFQHSEGIEPCDCTCLCPTDGRKCSLDHVCNELWSEGSSHCKAYSSAETLTSFLGNSEFRDKLALIYIDSKLSNSMLDFVAAGANVVKLLNKNVFSRGYLGQVIISGGEVKYTDYLKGAIAEAARTPEYTPRYFYTFDGEGSDEKKVWDELTQLKTDNVVYSTGISTCVPAEYVDAIKSSLARNAYGGIGIFTIDSPLAYSKYLDAGVTSIMTNTPKIVAEMFKNKGFDIPSPGNALVAKRVPRPAISYWECDCNYHSGGCAISKIPPEGYACKCTYKGAWTCGGQTVNCSDPSAAICIRPDSSKIACKFGGGDCGGY